MFRFTIRDVFWLTVVVALGVGWWLDHRHHATQSAVWVEVPDGGLVLIRPPDKPATLSRL